MKRIILVLLSGILMLVLLSGCDEEVTLKHYVYSYVLDVEDGNYRQEVVEDNNVEGLIRVRMLSTKMISWTANDDAEKSEYLSYARENNDLSWNLEVRKHDDVHLKSHWFRFTADKIVDITVTAESDWDEQTPAGSSLDDKFIFISGSPDQYIINGYKLDRKLIEEVKEKANPKVQKVIDSFSQETLHTMLPVCGTLSDINFENYKLLGYGRSCWFALMPIDNLSKGAKINIQIKFDSGKVVNYQHTCQGGK